jgi:hypothetical protein
MQKGDSPPGRFKAGFRFGRGGRGPSVLRLPALLVLALTISGCLDHSPRNVAESYIENLQQFNYAECYNLLSEQDRTDRSLQQFLTEIPLGPDVSPIWFRPVVHITHYELGDEHRAPDGATALVPVRVTTVNLPLWERTLAAAAGIDGSPGDLAQRSLDTSNYPAATYDDKIFLVKEHHRWRVAAGFVARDRVVDRYRAAIVDFYNGRLDESIAEYRSMIGELEQLPGTGNPGIAERFSTELAQVIKAKAEMSENTAYAPKLVLSKVVMRVSEERVPAIFGVVTNSGKRAIDQLSLAVTWYEGRDKSLKVVNREEHPIVLTPIEFTDFSRPVIPFLPGETRHFGFTLNAPIDVEQEAAPYVTIAWIGFTESTAPQPRLETAAASDPRPGSAPAAGARTHQYDHAESKAAAAEFAAKPNTTTLHAIPSSSAH